MNNEKATLKQWRKFRDFTQAGLGKAIGVSDQTIANWEKGVGEPGASEIPKLEKALAINWSEQVILMPKRLRKK